METRSGEILTDRVRIPTPAVPDREVLLGVLTQIVQEVGWTGPIGCGFPGVIRHNVIGTAHNLHPGLIGLDLAAALYERTGCPAHIVNDADAAGLAEARLGAAKDVRGVVILLTIGTGLGTALLHNGQLVPNTEFGHLIFRGIDAEDLISERARKRGGLSWKQWAKRLDAYLEYLAMLFSPEIFIVGGGGAKKPEKFAEFLRVRVPVRYATFSNRAGVIGAALAGEVAP